MLAILILTKGYPVAETVADKPWVQDFEDVWKTVRDRFYDPKLHGLDWIGVRRYYEPLIRKARNPDEASVLINEMLSRLETSHTTYYTKEDPAYYFLLELFEDVESVPLQGGDVGYAGIGIFTSSISGETFVRAVVDGGLLGSDEIERSGHQAGRRFHRVRPRLVERPPILGPPGRAGHERTTRDNRCAHRRFAGWMGGRIARIPQPFQ